MNGRDWSDVVGAIGVFTLLTVVISVTVVQLATTWRAKAALARESEYRTLADAAVRVQETTERMLAALGEQSGQMQAQLASIQDILKQVE